MTTSAKNPRFAAVSQVLSDFFRDKEKLTLGLKRLKEKNSAVEETAEGNTRKAENGTIEPTSTFSPESLQELLKIGERWEGNNQGNNPYYHSLQPLLQEIAQYRGNLPSSEQGSFGKNRPKEIAEQMISFSERSSSKLPPNNFSETLPEMPTENPTSKGLSSPEPLPSQSSSPRTLSSKTVILLQPKTAAFIPSTEAIHRFYDAQKVVGETNNQEILVYLALSKSSFWIKSLSGSGKSVLMNALKKALPSYTYKEIYQATRSSLFNDPDRNKVRFWIFPEIQKIFNENIEEITKSLTEGDSATYSRTNARRDGIETFQIKEKAVWGTFAINNRNSKKIDEELERRFIVLHTNITKEQNRRVAASLAENRFYCSETDLDLDPESGAFRKHLESALNFRGEVKNPFHGYIIKNIPLEISGEMRFRSSEKYFLALVSGCTLYHTIFPNAEKTLFSNLEENQKILTLYENALFNNVFDLSVVERAILDQLGEEPVSLSEVKERVYQIYSGINRELYKESLDRLASKEALVETDGNCIYRHPLPKIQLNPEEALTYAEEKMRAYCPEKRDEWLERNLKQLEHQVRSEEMPQMIPPVVPPADGGLSDG